MFCGFRVFRVNVFQGFKFFVRVHVFRCACVRGEYLDGCLLQLVFYWRFTGC